MRWPTLTNPTARRARIRALSKLLIHAGAILSGVGLGGLLILRPLDWSFAWGIVLGVLLYAAGELLIPYYIEPDDE